MILKMQNRDPESWIWLDNVTRVISVPCKIIGDEDDFEIRTLKGNTTYTELDNWYCEIRENALVNVLIIHREKPHDEKLELIAVESYGTFILGMDGKTVDRI